MSDQKLGWTAERVREHLQNAVYLEMWTVPLYLTAAYSINVPVDPNTNRPEMVDLQNLPRKPDGSFDFDRFTQEQCNQFAFDSILSVAIQEMLHVELAANILNAVRPDLNITLADPYVKFTGDHWAPAFNPPNLPYCLNGELPSGVTLKLGPLDDNQIRLFQWIEEKRAPQPDEFAYKPQYDSIGNFYTALSYGVSACWGDLYPYAGSPGPDELLQRDDWGEMAVKGAMRGRLPQLLGLQIIQSLPMLSAGLAALEEAAGGYPFSIKVYGSSADARASAEAAMLAIKAQGEGAGEGENVPPQFRPTTGEQIEILLDSLTHYERFTQIRGLVEASRIQLLPPPADPPSQDLIDDLQSANSDSYSSFLQSLESLFASDPSKTDLPQDAMTGIGNRTLQLWQFGLVPQYEWTNPNDFVDPSRTKHLHSCQGLNTCAGRGANGTGTKPGDGDCATAFFHTCGGTNMCAGQGGCGYPPSSSYTTMDPSQNSCQLKGGCGAPIPCGQIFSQDQEPNIKKGDSVWAYARKQMGFTDPVTPSAIRQALSPTSGTKPAPGTCDKPLSE